MATNTYNPIRNFGKLTRGQYPAKILNTITETPKGKRYNFIVWDDESQKWLKLATNQVFTKDDRTYDPQTSKYYMVEVDTNAYNTQYCTIIEIRRELYNTTLPTWVKESIDQTKNSLYKWQPSDQMKKREEVREFHRMAYETNDRGLKTKIDSMLTEEMKRKGWHLDHITPLASYNLLLKQVFNDVINDYNNLQPMLADENIAKGDSREMPVYMKTCLDRAKTLNIIPS